MRKPTVSEYSSRCGTRNGVTRSESPSDTVESAASGCNANLIEAHELVPRTVVREELAHARHRPHRHVMRAHDLAPEVHEAGVVTDVRVGQEHARERTGRRLAAHARELLAEVRRRVEQPPPSRGRVHEREARDRRMAAVRATVAATAGLR
jgi:ribonuclease D